MLKLTLEDDVTGITIVVESEMQGYANIRIKDTLGIVNTTAWCRDVEHLFLILRDQYEMFT